MLLEAANEADIKDVMFRNARKKCKFHEVNGINLGFAASSYGSGWGDVLTNQFLRDAFQIVKKGRKQPELFRLVSLFEENVASDRVSDMIATIIEPDIKKYMNIPSRREPPFRTSRSTLLLITTAQLIDSRGCGRFLGLRY